MYDSIGTPCRVLAIAAVTVALVAGLPWLAGFGAGASVFGFPIPAFLVVVLGPFLLALLAGTLPKPDRPEEDSAP